MIAPLERRLQLVTGKGGTGKTTLTAALGLAHASRGRRPLLVELGHRASLVRVLGATQIDHEVREILPGVHATNVAISHATAALVGRALPAGITARALRSGPFAAFLDAAPGVGEVATLDRLRHFVDGTDFDPILIDGDATGHTRMLFALHDVLASLGVGGPIAALLERISGVFADPALAAVHLACLPTALAIEETLELWDELRASGRVALGHVLLDRVEGLFAPALDRARTAELEARIAAISPDAASALALVRADDARRQRAELLCETLARRGITVRSSPERDDASMDRRDTLRAIGLALLDPEVSG